MIKGSHTSRIYFFIAVIGATLIFTSCSEEDTITIDSFVVGEWNVNSASTTVTINEVSFIDFYISALGFQGEIAAELAAEFERGFTEIFEGVSQAESIDFRNDGSYVLIAGSAKEEGSWTINDTEDLLTLNPGSEGEIIYDILSSSNQELSLESTTANNEDDLDGDGTPDTILSVSSMQLSR